MLKKLFIPGFIGAVAASFVACEYIEQTSHTHSVEKSRIDPGKDPKWLALTISESDTATALVDSGKSEIIEGNIDVLRKISASDPCIIVCSNLNYQGQCYYIPKGRDYNDLRYLNQTSYKNFNDIITSIEVRDGAEAWVCMDANWTGNCHPITTSVPDLRVYKENGITLNINDRITSIKWQNWSNGHVRVWEHPNYSGNYLDMYYPFDYNMIPSGLNDKISSYINYLPSAPPRGFPYFYQDPEGTSRIYPIGYVNFSNEDPIVSSSWNDQFSSMYWGGW